MLLLQLLRLDVDCVVVVDVVSLMPKAISELLLDDFVEDCTLCSEERFETLCVEVRNDIMETKPVEGNREGLVWDYRQTRIHL